MLWYISFIPLGIASALFVFCFLFESALWLYAICTAMFAMFAVLFVRADKQIACKEGYTLIQALAFYRECLRAGAVDITSESAVQQVEAIAQKYDYAKLLNQKQRTRLYKIGKNIHEQINEKRR